MTRLILVAAMFALTACIDSTSPNAQTGPITPIAGTYTLDSWADQRLPATIFLQGEVRHEVLSGSITFNPDMTYVKSTRIRENYGGGWVEEDTDTRVGTYRRENGFYSITWDGHQGWWGTVRPGYGTLVVSEAVYRK
jgi:hypothetical protein